MPAWWRKRGVQGRRDIHVPQFAEGCRRLRRTWQEVQGCVVPDGKTVAKHVAAMLREGKSKVVIERLCNHIHLRMELSSFDWGEGEAWTDDDLLEVAHAYVAMLERDLKDRFPDRAFAVELEREENEDGDLDLMITCYQTCHADAG